MIHKVTDYFNAGILGQNVCTINCLFILQKKTLRLIHASGHFLIVEVACFSTLFPNLEECK